MLDSLFHIGEVTDIDLILFTLKESCNDDVPSSDGAVLEGWRVHVINGNCGRNIHLHYNVKVYT